MTDKNKRFNAIAFVLIASVLALFSYTALSSGHPWALTCYQCRACNLNCPLGYDVASFVTAAATGNPNLYMTAGNLQLTLKEAYETDPEMVVEIKGDMMTSREAIERYPDKTVVEVRKLRAKDAAKYDPLEGACEPLCPIKLPITDIIRDLKDDGEFNE
jgi:L-lactate utilization protein LutB